MGGGVENGWSGGGGWCQLIDGNVGLGGFDERKL